jgi:chromosome segregation ATPase
MARKVKAHERQSEVLLAEAAERYSALVTENRRLSEKAAKAESRATEAEGRAAGWEIAVAQLRQQLWETAGSSYDKAAYQPERDMLENEILDLREELRKAYSVISMRKKVMHQLREQIASLEVQVLRLTHQLSSRHPYPSSAASPLSPDLWRKMVKLTHPDVHPEGRKDLAHEVMVKLNAMRPE